jgi:hypothetical protein
MDNEKEKKDRIEEMLRGAWRLAYGRQIYLSTIKW